MIPKDPIDEDETDAMLQAATHRVNECREQSNQQDKGTSDLVDALENRAELYSETGQTEAARDDYAEALMLNLACQGPPKQRGGLHAALGSVHDTLGDVEQAARHWEQAIECFEQTSPPSRLAVATIANNLGHLKRQDGDHDAAESAFLKAVEIFHTDCGAHDERTAIVATNLGSLYQEAGFPESSCDMFILANKAYRECRGDASPSTAASFHHLAIAFASLGNADEARRCFEEAIRIYRALGEEHEETIGEIIGHAREMIPGEAIGS